MATLSEALALALEHHQAGRLPEAEALYRQILQVDPSHADAHNNLGLALEVRGQLADAISCYERALQLRPDLVEAHNNLGNALKGLGRPAEALASYQRALERKPDYVEALNNLGNALKDQGRLAEAISSYQRALQLSPDLAEGHNNLGSALQAQGQFAEAIVCFRQALQRRPTLAAAHTNLGNALKDQGHLDEAIASYQHALQLDPNGLEAHQNLGDAFQSLGRLADASVCYLHVLQLKKDCVEAHVNLGGVRRLEGRLDEAVACCHRALELKPDCAEAYSTLGAALVDQGRHDEAVAAMQRARELKPESAAIHSSFLNALQYCPDVTLAQLRRAHQEYDSRHAAPLHNAWRPHDNAPQADRRLWLGFVSPHFERHPVGYFLIRALENLDRQEFRVVCYSDTRAKDDLTVRFHAAASHWRDMAGQTDEHLVQQVRADRIDILFDLAGHTGGNRLLAFARKPAPLQITWLDYEGSTGLCAMDYLLADRFEVPPQAEPWYVEKVLRMADGFVCYEPPASAPPVGPLPAQESGRVTLGCFNLPAKITPQVVATWARILQRLPESLLFLKYQGLDDAATAVRYQQNFADQGIAPERVTLEGWSPYAEFLSRYQQIDIALDPFPYTGGLTTCEALWMGVPVVTCPGETFASRHGLSHLSNVGLTETIARDLDHYVDLTVELAQDLPRLARLRAGLRQQVASSPLCDGKRFAANLMAILRGVWRQWVAGKEGERCLIGPPLP